MPVTNKGRSSDQAAVVVTGPTASGKSRLAAVLASKFGGEIVNCDAAQVYRGMDIGTAKATSRERAEITHHMLDFCEPSEAFSAGDYQRIGRDVLHRIRERSVLPIVVGGTGFYLRSLIDGLFDGPGRSEELRKKMRRIAERKGSASLHRALHRIDPESADRIAAQDLSRIIRAYEIFLITRKPMSWWQGQPRDRLEGFRWLKLAISWPRDLLYRRIDARVEEMYRQGFVDEVRSLLVRHPKACHAFNAIGYRQIIQYLEGNLPLEEAIHATQRETRRLAKRQLTWLRADPTIVWLEGLPGEEPLVTQGSELVQTFLSLEQE